MSLSLFNATIYMGNMLHVSPAQGVRDLTASTANLLLDFMKVMAHGGRWKIK